MTSESKRVDLQPQALLPSGGFPVCLPAQLHWGVGCRHVLLEGLIQTSAGRLCLTTSLWQSGFGAEGSIPPAALAAHLSCFNAVLPSGRSSPWLRSSGVDPWLAPASLCFHFQLFCRAHRSALDGFCLGHRQEGSLSCGAT